MRKFLLLAFFALAAVASGTAITLWKVKTDQSRKIEQMNRDLIAFNAQKDSITHSLNDATKFIGDVYVQVSSISGDVAVSNSIEKIDNLDYKAQIASRLQRVSTMVDGYKAQMKGAEDRLTLLKRQNGLYASQVKTLEETVGRLRTIIETQQEQIEKLTDELVMTRAERDRYRREALAKAKALVAKNEQLVEAVDKLNSAYYIVGTLDELSAKGIIEKRGKVLFVGGAWQPVAGLADSAGLVAQFKKIDIERELELPIPFQSYKLVSAHNPSYVALKSGEPGVTPYALKISRPDRFWAQSKFLIIVEW
jgi:hypothetical protein